MLERGYDMGDLILRTINYAVCSMFKGGSRCCVHFWETGEEKK